MPNSTVAVRLDAETQARLKALGSRRDRSPHYLMKEAVEQYLATEEAVEAELELMRDRWKRYELTGEHLTQDDMTAWAESLATTDKPTK